MPFVKISRETAIKRITEALEQLDDDRVLFDMYRQFHDSRTPLDLEIDGVKKRYRYDGSAGPDGSQEVIVLPEAYVEA